MWLSLVLAAMLKAKKVTCSLTRRRRQHGGGVLLDFRQQENLPLTEVLAWCQNYSRDTTIPRTQSLLARALLDDHVGSHLVRYATAHQKHIAGFAKLEAKVGDAESCPLRLKNSPEIHDMDVNYNENEL